MERTAETGFEYWPGEPVLVRVVHREHRISVTDDGAAVQRAGGGDDLQRAVNRVLEEFDVNISTAGVVSLPVVRAGPPESEVVRRIAKASLALYQEMLEADDR